ncbi:sialate O-acetylesterase [Sphingobium sp.]|uniref:sialate O-acetylesterase n=1 Tax=Sphingobium TaxID=165695 RepID=UPI001A279F96|nr:sialate O-acetylesterase [Sphingobium sp.]MBJ7378600.1 hypothetical protein [Sphingobium sp.]
MAIIIVFGQSNGAGIATDATGGQDNRKFTVNPPMPGVCLTFNGGAHPHPGWGSRDTAKHIDPARYESLVDMKVIGREGVGLGTAETYAAALSGRTKVLLINNCFSGSSFTRLFGKSKEPAAPWSDVELMIQQAVKLATESGLRPSIHGVLFNHGEANDRNTVQEYYTRLDFFRRNVNRLKK